MATNLDYEIEENGEILSKQEKLIKEQLESWITDVKKKAELKHRLQKAFENNKSHVQFFSE